MAALALDSNNPPELRGRMFAELAQYLAPKRKALSVEADQREQVIFQLGIQPRQVNEMVEGREK
jgi:hypothetical protein